MKNVLMSIAVVTGLLFGIVDFARAQEIGQEQHWEEKVFLVCNDQGAYIGFLMTAYDQLGDHFNMIYLHLAELVGEFKIETSDYGFLIKFEEIELFFGKDHTCQLSGVRVR